MKASLRYEHLREDERTAVIKAREHVATVDSWPECEQGSVIDEIASKFRRYELWQFLPTEPSIQQMILDATPDAKTDYEKARQGSRRLLFELAYDIICGPGITTKEDTLKFAKARTRLLLARRWGLFDDDVAEYVDCVAKKWISEGLDVLQEILSESHNAKRRQKNILWIDMHSLVMARHWVNPHCPLWMMSLPVLQKVLPAIAEVPIGEHPQWTPDTIRKRIRKLKDAGACRFRGEPIFDVKLCMRPETQPDAGVVSNYDEANRVETQSACEAFIKAMESKKANAIKRKMEKLMALEKEKAVNAETRFYDRGSGRTVEQFFVCATIEQAAVKNLEYSIVVSPQKPRSAKIGPKR